MIIKAIRRYNLVRIWCFLTEYFLKFLAIQNKKCIQTKLLSNKRNDYFIILLLP